MNISMAAKTATFNKSKKGTAIDRRVSVCGDCFKGIFTDHEYLWTGRGYVHQECEDKRLNVSTKEVT